MRFRKRPVVIDAVLWDGDPATVHGLLEDTAARRPHDGNSVLVTSPAGHITVRTLEGDMKCEIGDWLICGGKGEFYPCKSDIFYATYEPE